MRSEAQVDIRRVPVYFHVVVIKGETGGAAGRSAQMKLTLLDYFTVSMIVGYVVAKLV